jgi:Flp pilus assembly protein TadB
MFELTPKNIVILVGLALAAFFLWRMSTSSTRTEYAEDMSKEELKALVYSLAKNLKDSKEEDERLRKKIEDLQFADALQREQTKFLTANVNKTTSVL